MTLTTLIAGALLAAAPQSPSGLFAGVPLLLTTETREEVHVVGGIAGVATPAASMDPMFAAQQLFGASGLKIASFSTGRAFVTLELKSIAGGLRACADLTENNGSWSFILYSLDTTNGVPGQPGSPYQSAGGPLAGDVFARVLEGSENYIPQEQVGSIRWARLGADMAVSDVKGIDSFGYAQLLNPAVDSPLAIFFTVDTNACSYPSSEPRWTANLTQADFVSSNIFRVEWGGTGWGDVELFKSRAELDLAPGDAIDALTVDTEQGVILLSVRGPSYEKQLWVYSNRDGEPVHRGPYYDADGDRFYVDKYLLLKEGDDIDGACVDDPQAPEHSFDTDTRHQWRQTVMQLPLITFPNPTPPSDLVDCSGFRLARNRGLDRYSFYLRNTFPETVAAVLRIRDSSLGDPVVSDVFILAPGGAARFNSNFMLPDFGSGTLENPIYFWELSGRALGRVTSWDFQFLR